MRLRAFLRRVFLDCLLTLVAALGRVRIPVPYWSFIPLEDHEPYVNATQIGKPSRNYAARHRWVTANQATARSLRSLAAGPPVGQDVRPGCHRCVAFSIELSARLTLGPPTLSRPSLGPRLAERSVLR